MKPPSTLLFCGIHGFVRMPEQFVDIVIIRRVECDADAHADGERMRPDLKRRTDRLHDPLCDNQDIVFA